MNIKNMQNEVSTLTSYQSKLLQKIYQTGQLHAFEIIKDIINDVEIFGEHNTDIEKLELMINNLIKDLENCRGELND